jgi:hypothetical protein
VFGDYCTQVVAGVRQDLDGPDDEAFARLAAHVRAVAAARRLCWSKTRPCGLTCVFFAERSPRVAVGQRRD